ncbi:MAG: hypothetical protein AB2L14_23430 [Candidatus Xenobiia bacterium LiM19]
MGYSHYWAPSEPIEERGFSGIFHDFSKLYSLEDRRIKDIIRGPHGEGLPIISDSLISFNGDRHCRHESDKKVLFYVPGKGEILTPSTLYGTHVESSPVRTCSSGKCSCETITLFSTANRKFVDLYEADNDFFLGSVKTNYKPYDLAVQCLLIIVNRHVKNCRISSDGDDEYWFDAKLLCQMNLGYGLSFHLR